ncbi:MAG: hypothetical protein CMH57_02935 [Myxococcales bacterium]|nr:hypothetical protein [Myxococcales bacterium]
MAIKLSPDIALPILLTAACLVAAPTVASAQEGQTFVYTIKGGETCMSIAERFYGEKTHYNLIHQHNPDLGPLPHDLQPGQQIRLPLLIDDPDARVTGRRGEVRAKPPARPSWKSAALGLELYRAWRVNSRDEAAAELTFLDASRLYMRENTLVIIYGSTSRKIRRQTTEAELQYGTLRARMDDLAGGQKALEVSTPASDAELSGGEALINVDEEKVTRVANHSGRPARVAGNSARRSRSPAKRERHVVQVNAGMGSKVSVGQDPTPPKPLPPAPAWATPARRAVFAPGGQIAIFSFSWAPEPKASRYRVEFFADANRTRSLGATTTPGTEVELQQPPGSYFVTVSSIDDDKFEGPPSAIARVEVLPLKALGPNNTWLNEVDSVPAGSRLSLPDRGACTLNGEPASQTQLLVKPGVYTLRCQLPSAPEPVETEINVLPLEVDWSSAAGEATIQRGAVTPIEVRLSQDVHAPLKGLPPAEIEVGTLVKREPGVWETTVQANDGAPERFSLPIAIDVEGAPVLGAVEVQVERGAAPEEEELLLVELGALFDYGFLYASGAEGDLATNRSLLRPGFRAGLLVGRLVFVEAELAPVFDLPEEGEGLTRASYRAHAGVLIDRGALSPLILLGRGSDIFVGNDERIQPITYLGLGLRWEATRDVVLRMELRQGLVVQDDDALANQTSALLGVHFVY